jgi:FKBP-type peptidyl-prolyl cis-trans isomerase FkpA
MTTKLVMLSGLLLLCLACSQNKTPKGFDYTVVKKGDGNVVKAGEFLVLNMLFKDAKDSIWNDSRKSEIPVIFMIQDTSMMKQEEGIEEVLRACSKGDSVTFKVKASMLFAKTFRQPVPPNIDSLSEFTFNIGIKDIYTREQVTKLQEEISAKQNEKVKQEQAVQLEKDLLIIDSHLKEKNIIAQQTNSGLRYVISKPGKGENAAAGKNVKVDYAGFLLNGKCFDTSNAALAKANNVFQMGRPYEPLALTVGMGQVIAGWDEAITLMNKGMKMRVYIPSPLAYGNQQRSEDIVPNSILVFDMELVDVTDAPMAEEQSMEPMDDVDH